MMWILTSWILCTLMFVIIKLIEMNEQLIRFIELCLVDGVITDKEREVIFRKSNELGVLEDECEIILEGMIFKYNKENNIQNVAVSDKKNESNVP